MNIIKTKGKIIGVKDMSVTAREITIHVDQVLDVVPGCFINIFMDIEGKKVRRAYSISSDYKNNQEVQIAVRRKDTGAMSPRFWRNDIVGSELEIMGPIGKNTIDKMHNKKVFLVGYGIGVSVIKAVAIGLKDREEIEEVHIVTGSRDENDILYKDFFDDIASKDARFTVRYVLAQSDDTQYPYIGFAQEFIDDYDFDGADVYVCGQEVACNGLIEKVKNLTNGGESVNFFVEAFH